MRLPKASINKAATMLDARWIRKIIRPRAAIRVPNIANHLLVSFDIDSIEK